jgi:hypothetical protein
LACREQYAEAISLARSGIDSVVTCTSSLEAGIARSDFSRILQRAGEYRSAEREARSAIDAIRAFPGHYPEHYAEALATFAHAQLACEKPALALVDANTAVAILDTLDHFQSAEVFIRLVQAECFNALGDESAARRAIALARDRISIRAALIDSASLKESFLNEVPENSRVQLLASQWLPET